MSAVFPHLERAVLPVRDYAALAKSKRWTKAPIVLGDHHYAYENVEDLNDRRLRDAEVIAGCCANRNPKAILEIGTGHGTMTALMAENAPQATVHTVNIPIEELAEGGTFTTAGYTQESIGSYYRGRGLKNIVQIFANTARWQPDLGPTDIAFIDGCHDADFVYNDTRKILPLLHPGSVILWHDFNLELAPKYEWIHSVCSGVERLYETGVLQHRILHVRDSWVGMYVLPRAT